MFPKSLSSDEYSDSGEFKLEAFGSTGFTRGEEFLGTETDSDFLGDDLSDFAVLNPIGASSVADSRADEFEIIIPPEFYSDFAPIIGFDRSSIQLVHYIYSESNPRYVFIMNVQGEVEDFDMDDESIEALYMGPDVMVFDKDGLENRLESSDRLSEFLSMQIGRKFSETSAFMGDEDGYIVDDKYVEALIFESGCQPEEFRKSETISSMARSEAILSTLGYRYENFREVANIYLTFIDYFGQRALVYIVQSTNDDKSYYLAADVHKQLEHNGREFGKGSLTDIVENVVNPFRLQCNAQAEDLQEDGGDLLQMGRLANMREFLKETITQGVTDAFDGADFDTGRGFFAQEATKKLLDTFEVNIDPRSTTASITWPDIDGNIEIDTRAFGTELAAQSIYKQMRTSIDSLRAIFETFKRKALSDFQMDGGAIVRSPEAIDIVRDVIRTSERRMITFKSEDAGFFSRGKKVMSHPSQLAFTKLTDESVTVLLTYEHMDSGVTYSRNLKTQYSLEKLLRLAQAANLQTDVSSSEQLGSVLLRHIVREEDNPDSSIMNSRRLQPGFLSDLED